MVPRLPTSPLFPYTTLFRSWTGRGAEGRSDAEGGSGDGADRRARPLEGGGLRGGAGVVQAGRGAGSQESRRAPSQDRKSTRLNSSHLGISYAVFCLKKKK